MSSRTTHRLWITAASLLAGCPTLTAPLFLRLGWGVLLLLFACAPVPCQYPGQVAADKNTPQLRAVAVLEWTGDKDHPKATRLIPVCVYDGQDLEDASVYMAQPEPLALQSEVEYQLQQDGKNVGLFVVDKAGREQDSWVGFGKLKPLPKPAPPPKQIAKIDEDDAQSDEPVLHRKHRSGDSTSSSGSGANAPPADPDRPTLHKGGDASSTGSPSSSGDSGSNSSGPPPDPDRPTLHKSAGDSSTNAQPSGSNPSSPDKSTDQAFVEDVPKVTDPDRPRLFRGKSEGFAAPVLPSLMGLPADMDQEVAVSDSKTRPEHIWDFSWANPGDESKMKADLEDIARSALGLHPPPPPKTKPSPKTASARKAAKPASPSPAPLLDEQFRVFELAYGSGATMVLTAHTAGAGEPQKFVTLIAQPDLYGSVTVLLKNVTDAAHLDATPRMRLVDAVDVKADNRGELLFELRGDTQRQFALYRILRGDATRIFLTSPETIALAANNN